MEIRLKNLFREEIKKTLWDYNISLEDALMVLEGKKKGFSLNREKLLSRLLLSVKWYKLLEIFEAETIKDLLSDDVLKYIWIKDLRDNFIYARQVLNEL